MKKEKFWKLIAIISVSLLVIVIGTSSYYNSKFNSISYYSAPYNADLGDVCDKLHEIAGEISLLRESVDDVQSAIKNLNKGTNDYSSIFNY